MNGAKKKCFFALNLIIPEVNYKSWIVMGGTDGTNCCPGESVNAPANNSHKFGGNSSFPRCTHRLRPLGELHNLLSIRG